MLQDPLGRAQALAVLPTGAEVKSAAASPRGFDTSLSIIISAEDLAERELQLRLSLLAIKFPPTPPPGTRSHVRAPLRAPLRALKGWVPAELLRPILGLNSQSFADALHTCAARWRWSGDRRWLSAAIVRGSDPTWPVAVAEAWGEDLTRHRALAEQMGQGIDLYRAPPDGYALSPRRGASGRCCRARAAGKAK